MAELSNIKLIRRLVDIKHPATAESIGLRINLMSIDDPSLDKMKRRISDRRLYLEARGKHFSAEEIEENRRNMVFATVTGWEWYNPTGNPGDENYDANAMPTFHGEIDLEFNRPNFDQITDELRWIPEQIHRELNEDKAFFDGSK